MRRSMKRAAAPVLTIALAVTAAGCFSSTATTPADGGADASLETGGPALSDSGVSDGTSAVDAGDSGNATDASNAPDATPAPVYGDIQMASRWTQLGLAGVGVAQRDFSTAIFDGRYLYLAPQYTGYSVPDSQFARYDTQGSLTDMASWTTFDAKAVSAKAIDFMGGTFDGQYAYFFPEGRTQGNTGSIILRYDTIRKPILARPARGRLSIQPVYRTPKSISQAPHSTADTFTHPGARGIASIPI